MSNFDFLQRTPGFNRLYKIAVSAENNISIKPAITVMACRKALEITVRWLYKVEELTLPETTTLIELLKHRDFRYLVGRKVCGELHRLRKEGNRAIHGSPDPKNIPDDVTVDDGVWALSRLYLFLNWVDGFYGSHIGGKGFFSSAIETADGKPVQTSLFPSPDVEQKEQEEPVVISKPEDRKKQDEPILAANAPAEEPSFWEQMSVVDNVKEAYDWVWNLFGSEASKDADSAAAVEDPEENNSWWDPIQHGIEDAYDWVIEPLKRTVPTIISKSSDSKNKQKAMPPKNKRSSISPGKPKRTSSSSASRKSAKDNKLLKSVQHGIEDAYDWMTRPLKRYSPARKASVKLYSPIKKKKLA